MTNEVKVLNDDALQGVAERESIIDRNGESLVVLKTAERDSLCATVRALRLQLAQAEQAFELESAVKLPEVGNLNVLQIVKKMAELHGSNTALREQLARHQETLTALRNCQNKPACGHCAALLRAATKE